MQVFLPYSSFEKSAQALDDLRLGAQAKEVIQLLCAMENMDYWVKDEDVKIGHTNHPVYLNYHSEDGKLFLIMYTLELCREWYYRFGKQNQAFFTIEYFRSQYEEDLLPYSDFFDGDIFRVFQPKYIKGQKGKDQVITAENVFEKYQDLLVSKWNTDKKKPTWTKRGEPEFYKYWEFTDGFRTSNKMSQDEFQVLNFNHTIEFNNGSKVTPLSYSERTVINGTKNNV